ncbi:hypothetical protein TTRE_0000472101 [Trichuris trichiura]|uniref:Uncharacterized protein n=1 Tax=Trichuris trichiura TaxID=36087 RepID=A0A077Z893_TRITR|nr:hypothetical protein TTRE_0000472101 [Trichuris trichiura]
MKRINGLVSDQDFFALKALRIPDSRLQHLTAEERRKAETRTTRDVMQSNDASLAVDPFNIDNGGSPSNQSAIMQQAESSSGCDQRVIANLFCEVDKNLERAKVLHDQMQRRGGDSSSEGSGYAELLPCNEIDKQRRIGWFRQNICHFTVIVLLVITFAVLPILWFCARLLA